MNAETLYLVIPCYNEAETLEATLHELPKTLPGIQQLRILVVDDGSTDESVTLAKQCGVEVLKLEHVGLAQAYRRGLQEAVARGADLVITLDADGQYDPAVLVQILEPLQRGQADLVLVERGETFHKRLRPRRRLLHQFGAWAVRLMTGLPVRDPVTGYRAYTRRAVNTLQIRSRYTYTLETLVQVPLLGLHLTTLTAEPRPPTRPSKLVKHPLSYMVRQGRTLLWAALVYRLAGWGLESLEDERPVSADLT